LTKFLAAALFTLTAHRAAAAEVTGAGSSFVYPIISKWAEAYKKATGDTVNYQSIGSGGGIKQIQEKTVDFGATDKPLSQTELDQSGLVQFPIVNGAVVPVVNINGIKPGELVLTGAVLADIYAGKIKKWNDPAVTGLNQGVKLPDRGITVIHRSDGSGTSFIWTSYLSKASPEWKSKVGEGTAVAWPAGVGGKGNEGVASYVQKINGAIGYVEYAYALQSKLTYTAMKNGAGTVVKPDMASFSAAAGGAKWETAPAFELMLTDAPGAQSWPIAGSTFILMQKSPTNPANAKAALGLFKLAYSKEGAATARELNYVPLADNVVKLVETAWHGIKTQDGKPVL
jgi:phosphate transport system substrate-binding protein